MMIPTPSTSHVCFDDVYEPSEDSFLFLDTLSSPQEIDFLRTRFPKDDSAPVILEVGTGSGVIIAFLTANAHKLFGKQKVLTMAVDINREACLAAIKTIHNATESEGSPSGMPLGVIQADLVSSLRPDAVDILVFNPPYVPSDERPEILQERLIQNNFNTKFEQSSNLLALSYAGGADGMETTSRLLDELPRILSPRRGLAYILLCSQNHPNRVIDSIKSWGPDWNATIAGHSGKRSGWEVLSIIRISRGERHQESNAAIR
jgi:release factor glutamine methyltransferase